MQRLHIIGLGLMFSTMLSAPAIAQSLASNPNTAENAKTASAPRTPLPAQTLIDQAVKVAKANNKAVFVHVGASWCSWCHKLDQMLHSTDVGPIIAAHYVLVPLTALEHGSKKALENPGVDSVMQRLGMHGGPPMFAFLDADGKEIASSMAMPPNNGNIGYPGTPEEIKAFGELLQKTAPHMTAADRTKITDYLTSTAPKQ